MTATMEAISLGVAPYAEESAKVGTRDFAKRSFHECKAFKAQILRHYPVPMDAVAGVQITVCANTGKHTLEAAFGDDAGCNWAYEVEADPKGALAKWDEEAQVYLLFHA